MPEATLPRTAEVDQSRRAPGGLLARAVPPPDDWQRGLVFPFYGCGEPVVTDGCVTSTDEPHRPTVAAFRPFQIRQGSSCSMLSRVEVTDHALGRLDATTEWALGNQLATGTAGVGAASLADATSLGTFTSIVEGVAALMQAAADAGFGMPIWLHAPYGAIPVLSAFRLVVDDMLGGVAQWVFSPGYPQIGGPDEVRIWATSTVWAAVDVSQEMTNPERRQNTAEAWAQRAGIVAFDTCVNLSADVPTRGCPPESS